MVRRMLKSEAILLRLHRFGDTSLIVHWCAPEAGLLKTLARGARRPKSPFFGRLDLFHRAEIGWVPSRRSDLHALREVTLLESRTGLQESYGRLLAAAYFVRLLEMAAEREAPVPELHDLLSRALAYLQAHDPTPAAVTHYEREMARALGVYPGGTSAVQALRQLWHRLPEQRQPLLSWMAAQTARPADPPQGDDFL